MANFYSLYANVDVVPPHVQPLSQEKPMSKRYSPTGIAVLAKHGSRWYHLTFNIFAVRIRCTGSAPPSAPRH
jgi:hypothetical protein